MRGSDHDGLVLRLCRGHKCGKSADALEAALQAAIDEEGAGEDVLLAQEACFGKCFIGPNILVERWRDGQRNERALFAIMMNQEHDDMRFEHGITPEDVPKMLRWHIKQLQKDREENG